jgi:hypothetical protein
MVVIGLPALLIAIGAFASAWRGLPRAGGARCRS